MQPCQRRKTAHVSPAHELGRRAFDLAISSPTLTCIPPRTSTYLGKSISPGPTKQLPTAALQVIAMRA